MEGGEKERKGCFISFPEELSGRKQDQRGKGCRDIWADVKISSLTNIPRPEAGVQAVELLDTKGLASFHLSGKGTQGPMPSQPPQWFTTLKVDNSKEHLKNTVPPKIFKK